MLNMKYLMEKEFLGLPDEIHAQESLFTVHTLFPPHRLVPDAHLMLVCPHLCPPQPGGTTQHHCICLSHLLYRYICTLIT